ncbi:MAG: hypothetical protein US86_C0001G0093 [Candidatus Daviesbacteria bacterium GW2011_GWA2_38_24]|uniref:Uncharacterized protein n=1 Tax=Candidatus Daviesbacteria bacterium GW2011_GWA2_38_24 TaxID=1618422 RepID=A0A0G0MQI6_9BACT|nr:MAG: hypothetical protein US86_C0001G0093 [Candidatus Daviesbacteria bacterium GW2011_GWA2_38_24]KKQ80530.1 MAG: hypothetical protein UT01_C0010G0018 [Candidatus Daviesbacteria bacterium GW2011_GWA1_38_7]OGE23317.1 MAG: hypothetical protein A2688_04410 [Candidatus Daviesbacteria bacterium RIFCSPHIGHO2_01_FULL_38_8]
MLGKILAPQNRLTLILVSSLVVVLGSGFFAWQAFANKPRVYPTVEASVDFDPEGLYALLVPRRDGNAIVLNLKRVSSYEDISYELAYTAENDSKETLDRGVTGTLDTQDKKNEYTQEILFGTCSKGDTFSTTSCVFDKNVANGTLLLKFKRVDKKEKVTKVYNLNTAWKLQRPDISLGTITSADEHFTFKTEALREDLSIVGFSIVNELSGVPKLPKGKSILGKVYAFNIPTAKEISSGTVIIETADVPNESMKIFKYTEKENSWKELKTQIVDGKLTAQTDGAGIFAVLVDSK